MSDEKQLESVENKEASVTAAPTDAAPADVEIMVRGSLPEDDSRGANQRGRNGRGGRPGRRDDSRGREREPSEFNQVTLDLARVTRVTKGGKRMRFRATVIVGDGKGRVGFGTSKGVDVQASIIKAANKAKKNLITVPMMNETIPHAVRAKAGAADIMIMPAPKGSGIIAGGPVRVVLQLAGVPNASSKILGSNNKINNVRAAVNALQMLKPARVRASKEKAE
jgi:small subunit ribosomal protein S5